MVGYPPPFPSSTQRAVCVQLPWGSNYLQRAAELLDALPETNAGSDPILIDSNENFVHPAFTPNPDEQEARLEASELARYLLAKSLFDCKEFDRCAAVFLPDSVLSGLLATKPDDFTSPKGKGKTASAGPGDGPLPNISQRSLFLALHAKVLSGEKRRDEDTEMIMGPQDMGTVVNNQLTVVSRFLERWFAQRRTEDGGVPGSQGFLEYL